MIVFDANSLLNAAYVDGSWARQALELLEDSGAYLTVPPQAILEFDKILSKIFSDWRNVPILKLRSEFLLRRFSISQSPSCGIEIPPRLRSDAYLIDAALVNGATIISSDIPLITFLRSIGASAKTPLECIYDLNPSRSEMWSGMRPNSREGGFYFHCIVESDPAERQTVILDFPPLGRIAILRGPARVDLSLLDQYDILIPGCTYKINESKFKGVRIELRFMLGWKSEKIIFLSSLDPYSCSIERKNRAIPKRVHFGAIDGLTCTLLVRSSIFTDRPPPPRATWLSWLSIGDYATPQPFDADRLRSAVLKKLG